MTLTLSLEDTEDLRQAAAEAEALSGALDETLSPAWPDHDLDECWKQAREVVRLLSRIRRRQAKRREARQRRDSVLEG